MAQVYSSAANHLQYHPYHTQSPQYHTPIPMLQVSDDEAGGAAIDNEVAYPLHDPFDQYTQTASRHTINQMVDMLHKKVPFTITRDLEVLEISHQIDMYLEEIREFPKTAAITEYLSRLLPLRKRIARLRRRVLNLHPEWSDQYRGMDSGYLKLLYKLIEASGQSLSGVHTPSDAMERMTSPLNQQGGFDNRSLEQKMRDHDKAAGAYSDNTASAYGGGGL